MYLDVLCVQVCYVFDLLQKDIEKFSFFKISQKVKLLDPINALQNSQKHGFCANLSYNTTLYQRYKRRYKHKGGKTPRGSAKTLSWG